MKKAFIIIIAVSVLIIIGVQSLGKASNTTTQTSKVSPAASPAENLTLNKEVEKEIPAYKIASTGDISFGNVKRYQIDVVIDSMDALALKQISQAIIDDFKTQKRFNAVAIFFYDHEEFIGYGYTLGKATYAPFGEWGKAMDISTGDYKNMEFLFEIKQKDIKYQLTSDEAGIVKQWHEAYTLLDTNPDKLIEDDEVSDYVAKLNGIDSNQVDEILTKWIMWQM